MFKLYRNKGITQYWAILDVIYKKIEAQINDQCIISIESHLHFRKFKEEKIELIANHKLKI
jgi:hypothetical protein